MQVEGTAVVREPRLRLLAAITPGRPRKADFARALVLESGREAVAVPNAGPGVADQPTSVDTEGLGHHQLRILCAGAEEMASYGEGYAPVMLCHIVEGVDLNQAFFGMPEAELL
jgi:hypothetical protein